MRQSSHTIVYTGQRPPTRRAEEAEMMKDPIRVIPSNANEKLDPMARINFGKVYPIEHNVKVKEIGQVDEESIPKLRQYFKSGLA